MTRDEANKLDYIGQAEFHTNVINGVVTAKIKVEDWDDWGNFEMKFKTAIITD
jgi:hypothetical protein